MIVPAIILLVVSLGGFGLALAWRWFAARPSRADTVTQPRMLWPFAAVLLPLLALAGSAGWTLLMDRRSGQDEARARSEEIASAVLDALERGLNVIRADSPPIPSDRRLSFSVALNHSLLVLNERFELASPSPWVWPPPPAPLTEQDFAALTSDKLAEWQAAGVASAREQWSNAAALYLAFLDGRRRSGSEPMADWHAGIASSRFRPLAQLHRAQCWEHFGTASQAIAAYNDVLDDFVLGRGELTESGVPVAALAARKILELAGNQFSELPQEWRSRPVELMNFLSNLPASPLTDECLQRLKSFGPEMVQAVGNNWREEMIFKSWTDANRSRQRFEEAVAVVGTNQWPEVFWINGAERWLAVRQTPPPGWPTASPDTRNQREFFYAVFSAREINMTLDLVGPRLWRQFVVLADVCGQTLSWPPDEKAVSPGALAQSVRSLVFPITVSVGLRDADAYFRSAARRQTLFSVLILIAVGAGVAAAWTLRRSLFRQFALNEQKSNFVSSVSHELRAPIASVRLLAESLERGTVREPAQQREYFRFIGQECRRLSALIENVLDFARIEQGRKQYEFEPTDLRVLVATTVRLMEPMAMEKGVSLGAKMPDDGCRIPDAVVDGRAIQQALVNLLDNAIKHSPAGAVVEVRLEAAIPDAGCQTPDAGPPPSGIRNPASGIHPPSSIRHSRLLLSVTDHGPGIPASEHARIFERFHRLGSELRRETQGVGIGLSIVKHIVEAHSGRVRVESEVGRGSRFVLELPVSKSEIRNPKLE
jgi:signal transduction histidine kinase